MNQPTIYITQTDKDKLDALIREAQYSEYRGHPAGCHHPQFHRPPGGR
jgi:hypothetical protein